MGIKILTISFIFLVFGLQAQYSSYRQYKNAGDLFFEEYKDYHNAGEFYKKAYEFHREDSLYLSYRIAESAYNSWELGKAEIYYLKLVDPINDTICNSEYPIALLHLGEVYQRMAKYESAIQCFDSFRSLCIEDQNELNEADRLKEACLWALGQKDNKDIKIDALVHINDSAKHELAPLPFGDSIIYTSFAFPDKRKKEFEYQIGTIRNTLRDSSDLFFDALYNNRKDTTVGFLALNTDQSRIFYSVCYATDTRDRICRLVSRALHSNDPLGVEEKVILGDKMDTYTYIHPYITWDSVENREVLFFVSDRPGGKGGLDIWYMYLNEDGKHSSPHNLESINTSSDDVSPFYDNTSQTLYFSTDHIYHGSLSYGGKDIFKAKKESSSMSFVDIEILERPFNSSKNDIFYIHHRQKSWLSSNRTDPRNVDPLPDGCCYDIFEAVVPIPTDTVPIQSDELLVQFTPEFSYYCDLDTFRVEVDSKTFLINVDNPTDTSWADRAGTFHIKQNNNYQLKVKYPSFDTSFNVEIDSSNLGIQYVLDGSPNYLPKIFDYCSSERIELDDIDRLYLLPLIGDSENVDSSLDTIFRNSFGLFPVIKDARYRLMIEKKGYQKAWYTVKVDSAESNVFCCDFFIQKEHVNFNVLVKYTCDELTTYLSTEDFTAELSSSQESVYIDNRPLKSFASYNFKVTSKAEYTLNVILKNGIELPPRSIQIQTGRENCAMTFLYEYTEIQ